MGMCIVGDGYFIAPPGVETFAVNKSGCELTGELGRASARRSIGKDNAPGGAGLSAEGREFRRFDSLAAIHAAEQPAAPNRVVASFFDGQWR